MDDDKRTVERQLIAALRQRDTQIKHLQSEMKVLRKQLAEVRRLGVQDAQIERSTSAKRLMIEHVILDTLRTKPSLPTESRELWYATRRVGVQSRATLRSHLRRMKQRGLVVSPSPSLWQLAPSVSTQRHIPAEVLRAITQLEAEYRRHGLEGGS